MTPSLIATAPCAGVLPGSHTPPQAFGQLPLQGGARFLVSGPVAEPAQPLKSSPAGIFESPLPSGEGVRGRGQTTLPD